MSSTTMILNCIVIVFISQLCTLHAFTLPPAPIIGSVSANILNSQVGKTAALSSFAPLNHGPTRRRFHPSLSVHFQNLHDDTQMSSLPDSSDPYIILNLSRQASKVEMKMAYRKRALQYHPDARINASSTEEERRRANEDFARINAAYAALKKMMDGPIHIKRAKRRKPGTNPVNGGAGSDTHVNKSGPNGHRATTSSTNKKQVNKSPPGSKGYGGTSSPYVTNKRVNNPIIAKGATPFKSGVNSGVTVNNVHVNKSGASSGRTSSVNKSQPSSKGYGGTSSPYVTNKKVNDPIIAKGVTPFKSGPNPNQPVNGNTSKYKNVHKSGVGSDHSSTFTKQLNKPSPSAKGYGGTSSPFITTKRVSTPIVNNSGVSTNNANVKTKTNKPAVSSGYSRDDHVGIGTISTDQTPGSKGFGATSSPYIKKGQTLEVRPASSRQGVVGTGNSNIKTERVRKPVEIAQPQRKGYGGTSSTYGHSTQIPGNLKSNQVRATDGGKKVSRPASSTKDQKNWGEFFDPQSFHSQWNTDSQNPMITNGVQTIYESEESFKNSYTGYGGTSSENAESSYQPQISNVGSYSKIQRPSIEERRCTGDFFDADHFHEKWNPANEDSLEQNLAEEQTVESTNREADGLGDFAIDALTKGISTAVESLKQVFTSIPPPTGGLQFSPFEACSVIEKHDKDPLLDKPKALEIMVNKHYVPVKKAKLERLYKSYKAGTVPRQSGWTQF